MMTTALRTFLLTCVSATLFGCSALQVDVDVYKGPLLHTPEVQQRQYAYMAISAKPLIERLLNNAKLRQDGCEQCPSKPTYARDVEFLKEILKIYSSGRNIKGVSQNKFIDKGIEDLSEGLAEAYGRPGSSEERELAIREAFKALNERLIYLAQRILFIVNNEALVDELDMNDATLMSYRSVLQSFANTLLVHANDLSRQQDREEAQTTRKESEVQAIRSAFIVPPVVAFDAILRKAQATAAGTATIATGTAASEPKSKERERLLRVQDEWRVARDVQATYRQGLAFLLAAHHTLVADATLVAPAVSSKLSATEAASAAQDRRAIIALYPAQAAGEADRVDPGAIDPLRTWLVREQLSTISIDRKQRLTLTLQHLESDRSRLVAETGSAATKAAVLKSITSRISLDLSLARKQDDDLSARVATLKDESDRLLIAIGGEERELRAANKAFRIQTDKLAEAQRIKAVLEGVRVEVLAQAQAARVSDARGVHTLLVYKLSGLVPGAAGGSPTAADIELTRQAVAGSEPTEMNVCVGTLVGGDKCTAKDQMDAVDQLIAALRAQRVKALANGDSKGAEDLLAAINAAYDQRTAMIYLRPASDYLQSVYSATEFQESTEPVYRNMINDWARYLKPEWEKFFRIDGGQDSRRRPEIEKLHWQSINRVTLGGGGFTNFVVAKDDVGNWYVKAYSSDPKTIFKSAVNLAKFNAGSRLNVNLLQRQQIQQRIDESKDPTETKELDARLANLNNQDGRPLLKLRTRYAEQYEAATLRTGAATYDHLAEMPSSVNRTLEATHAASTTASPNVMGNCKVEDLKATLEGLDLTHLEKPRMVLKALLDKPDSLTPDKLLMAHERAIQQSLTALYGYGGQLYKALDESSIAACPDEIKRKLALKIRDVPRMRMQQIARDRRSAVERYEEALTNISEAAVQ